MAGSFVGSAFPEFVISFDSSLGNCVGLISVNFAAFVGVMAVAHGSTDVSLLLPELIVFRSLDVGPCSVCKIVV